MAMQSNPLHSTNVEGIHIYATPSVFNEQHSAHVVISCRGGPERIVLEVPRAFDIAADQYRHSRREIIERLISQLTAQLAVEALEGR